MYIVETNQELSELKEFISGKSSYWFPMWSDFDLHPLNNSLSFIFIYCDGREYVLPYNHIDTLSIDLGGIVEVISSEGCKWVFQTKKLLHSLKTYDLRLYDVDTAYFLKTGNVIDYRTLFDTVFHSWKSKGYYNNLTKIVPILKLCEVIQSIIPNYLDLDAKNYNFDWYNNTYIPILSQIEKFGIRVNSEKVSNRWPNSIKHITTDEKLYTEYNPFTLTGRPSNRYGGINFSALNKTDGSRECFISDGIFLQMDYDAYHPRLIGKLIGFELPKTSVHRWLSEQYGCSYDESKGITFQLLYGGIPDEFLSIPYFRAVKEWIDKLWIKVQKDGYLTTLKRRISLDWIESPNPQKVFNYLLQAVETEINMDKIDNMLKTIEGTDIKFILYTYDSVLIDYPLNYSTDIVKKIKEVMEGGEFPIKASWGDNYSKI
jgi:hypothetical protein